MNWLRIGFRATVTHLSWPMPRLVSPLAVALACLPLAALAAEAPGASAWPMFRGEPSLRGLAAGRLPASPDLLWSYSAGGPIRSSAAIADGRVFVAALGGGVHAIDLATGNRVWHFKLEDEVEASPLVLDGTVYLGAADAFFYALDARTGALKWKVQTGDKILGAANWLRTPSGETRLVVGSYDGKLYCLAPADGRIVWSYETGNYINGAPAIAGNRIVFGGCDALLHVLDADGQKVSETEVGAYVAGSVAAVGDRVYFGHYGEEVLCVDLAAKQVRWTFRDRAFPFFSSPAVTDRWVLIGGRDKRLHCLDRETGRQAWEFAARAKVDSSPVVCGDSVVFGSDDGRLYVVELATGREAWSYEIGKGITASPAVAGGKVVIGAEDGTLYAFGKKS